VNVDRLDVLGEDEGARVEESAHDRHVLPLAQEVRKLPREPCSRIEHLKGIEMMSGTTIQVLVIFCILCLP
jgi:hypothetical protein